MIVVDSSVAMKWIVPEKHSALALALFGDHIGRSEQILVPPLFVAEVSNVIRQQMRREGVPARGAQSMLERLLAMTIVLWPLEDAAQRSLSRRALNIAAQYDLSATYDAHYLALAELMDCSAWTADERLLRQLNGRSPRLRSLETYQPAH